MNNIVNKFDVISSEINNENYVVSLINLCYKYEIIDKEELESISLKLFDLLRYVVKKYNNGVSSINKYLLKEINLSNNFIISQYLKEFSLREQVKILLNESIFSVYDNGLNLLKNKVMKTKLFYNTIFVNNMLDVNNYFYNATLKDGIRCFFKKYDYVYKSTDKVISVDYDVFNYRSKGYGIDFISEYLLMINEENVFCNNFDSKKISLLIKKLNLKTSMFNIFELILTYALVLMYLDKNIFKLELSIEDINKLYLDNNLENNLLISFEKLKSKLIISSYVEEKINYVIKNILFLKSINKLNSLIYLDKNIYYKTYKRLDSDKYLEIVNNINNSSFRVNELFTNVRSFYDFLDIINYVNFSENEMFAIFNKLNVVELMLVKKYCSDNVVSCLNSFLYSKSRDTIKYINNNYQYVFMEEV